MTDPIRDVLVRAAPAVDADAGLATVHRRHRRGRWRRRLVGAGAGAVVVLAVLAGVLAVRAGDGTPDPSSPAAPTTQVEDAQPSGCDAAAVDRPGVPYATAAAALDERGTAIEDRFGAITARVTAADAGQEGPEPAVIEVTLPSVDDCPAEPQVVAPGIPVSFVVFDVLHGSPAQDVQVVERGILPSGRHWRQVAFLDAAGQRCTGLFTPTSGGASCGALADPLNLGQTGSPELMFLEGVALPEVATVRFHLSTGEVVDVGPTDAGDEVNYVVLPVEGGVQVTDVDALDAEGDDLVLGNGATRFMTDEEDRAAIVDVFLQWLSSRGEVEPVVEAVEGGEELRPTIEEALATAPQPAETYSGRVDDVQLVGEDRAIVHFRIVQDSGTVVADLTEAAVRVDGRWKVSRTAYCEALAIGPLRCPPG